MKLKKLSIALAVALIGLIACAEEKTISPFPQVIEPNSGWKGAPTKVEVSGEGFLVQIKEKLDEDEEAEIIGGFTASLESATLGSHPLLEVTFHNSHKLSAIVPAELPLGIYDLTVTNPDGKTGTLPKAYKVTAIWFVNDDAPGANNGTSWEDAFTVIQDAVDVAASGDWIWVAEGIYKYGTTATVVKMKDGVEIYGGFQGVETRLSARVDPANYASYLNGDRISYHVVIGASNARLDGFHVSSGGAADDNIANNRIGGGMYNFGVTDLLVVNCVFSGNFAVEKGGGMYNSGVTDLVVENCTFSANAGDNPGGGGIYNTNHSSPKINNCTFSGNFCEAGSGGGIYNEDNSSPEITNCTFEGNWASEYGGGINNEDNSSPTVINCIFYYNGAWLGGGGMHNSYYTSPEIKNCTFANNNCEGGKGGGMYTGTNSSSTITNCIVWNNYAEIGTEELYNDVTSTTIVTYSNVKGGWPGMGNIGLDPDIENPLFVPGPGGNYYLSQAATNEPGQVSDSPCVDAGSDTAANLGLDEKTTRTDGLPDTGTVDMGYHYEPLVLTP